MFINLKKRYQIIFLDFTDKAVQVKFADASKNKKLYKSGIDVCIKHKIFKERLIISFLNENNQDMKTGPPLYSPMEQAGPYPSQTVLYSPWAPMSPQQVPVPAQPAPPPQIYGPAAHLRPTLPNFNPHLSSYVQSPHENGAAFVVPLPVQQLQQLQIATGHPGTYCVINPAHPGFFMPASQPQPQSQPQHDQ